MYADAWTMWRKGMEELTNIARRNRILVHTPHGFGIVLAAYIHPVLAVIIAALFIYYERNEDHWVKDQAWKDVAGAILGIWVAMVVIIGYRLITTGRV